MTERRICGASRPYGLPNCRRLAMKGKTRCARHGGKNTGPKTAEGWEASIKARTEGRRRWYERMQALRVAGLIDVINPGGGSNRKSAVPKPQPLPGFEPKPERPAIEYTRENALHAIEVLREKLLGR